MSWILREKEFESLMSAGPEKRYEYFVKRVLDTGKVGYYDHNTISVIIQRRRMRTKNPALREDMRDQIIDAANRLIERYGYKKTTMEDIAREAGIGKGTIYLYFPSKEEVALSCCARLNNRVCERLRWLSRADGAPAERLKRMIVERVTMKLDAISGFGQSLDDILADLRTSLFERREKWLAAEAEIFAEVLIEGRLLGAFHLDDALQTAHALLTATTGLMPSNLSPRELVDREGIRNRASHIAGLLISGLQCA